MNPRPLLFVAIALPLAAQTPSSPIRAVGAMQAIAHDSGLQADREGDGLTGLGAAYAVRFRDRAVRCEPALGVAAPTTQFVELTQPSVTRGGVVVPIAASVAPTASGRVASYARAEGVEERFDVQPDGVELSWTFATRPPGEGDLVVRYALATSLGAPTASEGGLGFARDYGGVRIGKVTGIDARGRRADGEVQWDGAGVRFSLPAGFVDAAAYPLVLDPTIGATFAMNFAAGGMHSEPDAAYDATTDRWLVVWLKTFSATDVRLVGQIVSNATGVPIQFVGFLGGSAVASSPPRVVDHGLRDEFGVAWSQTSSTGVHSVQLRRVSATSASIIDANTVDASSSTSFGSADIGALVEPPAGSSQGYTVVYRSGTGVMARVFTFSSFGLLLAGPGAFLWSGTASQPFSQPAVSRAAAADGRLLVVAVRQTGSSYAIVGRELQAGTITFGASVDLVANTTHVLSRPDVDGFDGRWMVACEDAGSGLVLANVRVLPVTLDAISGALVPGAGTAFGGSISSLAFAPRLAWAPGRTWLAFRSAGGFGGTTATMRVAALDSTSCVNCNDPFAVTAPAGAAITVATMTSGGVVNGELALCAWQDASNQISAQRLQDFGTVGTTTSLGGGCGATGTVAFHHAPGIGSSGFRCSLTGLPATVLATIFNFSAPATTIPCAACVWTPFAVTQSPPMLGGSAFVEFPIPRLTTLVGRQFETQWTLIDFSQAPCVSFPGLALSDRTLLTIGN